MSRPSLLTVLPFLLACGASAPRPEHPPSPTRVVEMEEMRITAVPRGDGEFAFESYDAEGLFKRGTQALDKGACDQAAATYDKLVEEFPESRYASPALYNAGLCLAETGRPEQAISRYESLVRDRPDSPDVKDAAFQLTKLYVDLERWDEALELSQTLLAREDLDSDERVEAMARRAQAFLGLERLEDAEKQARTVLGFARHKTGEERVRDTFFVAAANFVLAEVHRERSEAIVLPVGGVPVQRAALERRAALILNAQREYFNTIRGTDPHWAAASGYRIGQMYDGLWEAIMSAPVPPPSSKLSRDNLAVFEEEYRKELARLIKPLVRHSIRYWELTLMMVERTGVRTAWTEKIKEDLARARARLLEQPEDPVEPETGPPEPARGPAPDSEPPDGEVQPTEAPTSAG